MATIQSNYIPWKGYFDIIDSVDEFILFDHVQYTKNDWRNRNRIKTKHGIKWITIPVKHSINQKINKIQVVNSKWQEKHWKTLTQNYSKAPYFNEYCNIFEELYRNLDDSFLSKINYRFIKTINKILGVTTKITWSDDYYLEGNKTESLIDLCKKTKASEYITGPSAETYIKKKLFDTEGIKLTFFSYSGYTEYKQLFPPFDHYVTILDLLFNQGVDGFKKMRGV